MTKEQSMYTKYLGGFICLLLFGWNFLSLFWRTYIPVPYENSSRTTTEIVTSPTKPLNATCAVVFFVGMIGCFICGINDYNSMVSEGEENCSLPLPGGEEVPPSPTIVQQNLVPPNLVVGNVIPFVRPTADGTVPTGKLSPEEFRNLIEEDPWISDNGVKNNE
ncbi:MAG: hypothetical protein KME64_42870 [Scytonematopsis contorta HA4267-MV1]|nr:hypothetical protein [Scytonematopsis contorta HA4267-MV1]